MAANYIIQMMKHSKRDIIDTVNYTTIHCEYRKREELTKFFPFLFLRKKYVKIVMFSYDICVTKK